MRNAGLEWTDTLGSVRGGMVGWAARKQSEWSGGAGQNKFERAGKNIHHFRYGKGADVEIAEKEVQELQSQTSLFSAVERQFIDLLVADMTPRPPKTKRQYIAMNGNPTSPNMHTPWFGAYATEGTGWYYAIGGFLLAYGAITVRHPTFVAIWYRSFVHDRYNWDPGKETKVPAEHLSYLLNDSVMGKVAGMKAPDGLAYFSSGAIEKGRDGKPSGYKVGEKYVAADALLGALEESGDAARYDINGSGPIKYISHAAEEK